MNLPRLQSEMQEDSLWSLCPVQDIDTLLTDRLLYCDLYLRQFKETLKQTMLGQESLFETQIHELHRLYQRQKDLMIEMEETNNFYGQPQHLVLNAGVSSPRRGLHWMGSNISTSKVSVSPPEDAFAKIEDEFDKSGTKDIWEEEEEASKNGKLHEVLIIPKDQSPRSMSLESVVQPENEQHSTGLSSFKCILDLNKPAKIEEHSDYELSQFLTPPPATRSERAEPEAEDPPISTKSQAENGIDLNMSPLSSEEEVTIEPELPREFVSASLHRKHGSEPSRSIVLALPSSKTISLFHKRYPQPRKKAKRGAKSTTVENFPRSKARKGSNLDSNFGVDEDDNHSLCTSSYIPESDHNQKYLKKRSFSSLPEIKPGRSWKNTGKRRRCRPQIGSGKAIGKIPRTKSKTRGSFLVTEDEEQEKSVTAAEAIVDMSSSDSARKFGIKTADCITPLSWFAKIATSVVEDSKSEVGLSVTGFHSHYEIDYFEEMTLQLTEMEPEEEKTNTSVSNSVHPKRKRTRHSQGKRQKQHDECLSSLIAGNEASQDLKKIGKLIEPTETNDAHSSLLKNMVINWEAITKRRRGIRRSHAANTKTSIPFLLSDS